jgi:hypothetical protein
MMRTEPWGLYCPEAAMYLSRTVGRDRAKAVSAATVRR